jgi:hypothetical protein
LVQQTPNQDCIKHNARQVYCAVNSNVRSHSFQANC